ncbi:MAG: hypothetical protein RL297_1215 [Pseudomonadota bacterium]|jgi:disulfide bond formation protein DsbB
MTVNPMFVHRHTGPGLAVIALGGVLMLAYGLYLQHAVGLEPCPMCIVQRYAWVLITVVAGVASLSPSRWRGGMLLLLGVLALMGAGVAARQSWLQWFPPEIMSCGRDLFGMIEAFPLQRVIPMLLKGSGDCSAVDWTFLGLTIANWSFLCFVAVAAVAGAMLWARHQAQTRWGFS